MANSQILYLEVAKRQFILDFLNNNPKHFYRNEDGKIDAVRHMMPNPPWVYVKPGPAMDCNFWHHILFRQVFNSQKVPIHCQNCWKVVVMPRDLEELFATYFLQLEMGLACKCGTETERDNTDRHYGGYWYNNSLPEGLECHQKVREAIDRDKVYERTILGCPIKVRFNNGYDDPVKLILKRGCTEFEQNCGASDKWSWDQDQVELERIAFHAFTHDLLHSRQSENQLSTIFHEWIHRAFRIGDEKYKLFTNGNRLFDPPVTYHDMPKKKLDAFMKSVKVCPR
jgi:hypothetical protein